MSANPAPPVQCTCVSVGNDARSCYWIRYSVDPDDYDVDDGRCECACHHTEDDDDDES
jgi:hypothetical protein